MVVVVVVWCCGSTHWVVVGTIKLRSVSSPKRNYLVQPHHHPPPTTTPNTGFVCEFQLDKEVYGSAASVQCGEYYNELCNQNMFHRQMESALLII